jgi:hypothetical protein
LVQREQCVDLLELPSAISESAECVLGYCTMARMLDMMPWNRQAPLTWSHVREVVTRPPGDEGLLAGMLARR